MDRRGGGWGCNTAYQRQANYAHGHTQVGKVGRWEIPFLHEAHFVKQETSMTSERSKLRDPRTTNASSHASPRPHSRSSRNSAAQTSVPPVPGILDAVIDQHDDHWIRYGRPNRSVWFKVTDLISASSEVFKRLSSVGAHYLTRQGQDRVKTAVEQHTAHRDALVAARPGWLGHHFVFGDGTVVSPKGDAREIIIAFEAASKFSPVGSLPEWQREVGPLVTDQPLPLFTLCYAFVPPLMRFVPPGYPNPGFEVVGEAECGKSTLGVIAESVWAGDPNSDCGGGVAWDLTLNSIDDIKRQHRDTLLFLDEGNLAGANLRERKELIQQAVFKLASTEEKARMGDKGPRQTTNLATLSTTNSPLCELAEGTVHVRGAAHSRMITIRVADERPFGVLRLCSLWLPVSACRHRTHAGRCELELRRGRSSLC